MKILSVNAGSSSLKFTLYEMPEEELLISGYIEKIGLKDSFWTTKINGKKIPHKLKPHQLVDYGLARTFQNIRLFKQMTVLDNVMVAFNHSMKTNIFSNAFRISSISVL